MNALEQNALYRGKEPCLERSWLSPGRTESVESRTAIESRGFIPNSEGLHPSLFLDLPKVISASLVVLVIRSRRSFFKSTPGKYLLMTTLLIVGAALIFPFTPLGDLFGFRPPPISFLLAMAIIVVFYIISAEVAKGIFYKRAKS